MSTRQRSNRQSNLPPKREGKVVRHDVSKPLQHVSLSRVVHLLTIFLVLYCSFYAYKFYKWKTEVGGWWNLATGKHQPHMNVQQPRANMGGSASTPRVNDGGGTKQDVALESHIHAIASILGMQPTDLASALSNAVHQHVAPKTISSLSSSVSSSAASGGTSAPAANILFDRFEDTEEASADSDSGSDGVVKQAGTVAKAVEAIVGFDEPVVAD